MLLIIKSRLLLLSMLAVGMLAMPALNTNTTLINAQTGRRPVHVSQYADYSAIRGEDGAERELYPGGIVVKNSDVNSRESLRLAQKRLQARGFYDGPMDGLLTKTTSKALKKFQADQRIDKTGRLDFATTEALGLNYYTVSYDSERVINYDLTSPKIIAYVQIALHAQKLYTGPIDGVLNQDLQAGIKTFQSNHQLPATGQLDDATAEALRLHAVTVDYNRGESY